MIVRGPILGGRAMIEGQDSQPVSGLLIAGAFGPCPIELEVQNPGERPWVDLTLDWFRRLGIPYSAKDHMHYRMEGGAHIDPFDYTVPGDWSTAAFPIAAALLTNSELTIENVDIDDCQGDKKLLTILENMGAHFEIRDKKLTLLKESELQGATIDVNDCIDALPILAVIGCFARGRTVLYNGAIARKKESDRIRAMATELTKMGARIEETSDGLVIEPAPLHGAQLQSYHDHRLALALTVAALASSSESEIQGVECIAKTYPQFVADFQSIGAKIEDAF